LKTVEGGAGVGTGSRIGTSSSSSALGSLKDKEKKKERGTLAGFFSSEKKDKDKDKDKDKKDRPGSYITPQMVPMKMPPPPAFKKPGPPNRPASQMDRPSPKNFVRPASQIQASDDSIEEPTPQPPLNLQSKLRPTPKSIPKPTAADMVTASGTTLRKLAAPPVTGIPKSPTMKRAPAPAPGNILC